MNDDHPLVELESVTTIGNYETENEGFSYSGVYDAIAQCILKWSLFTFFILLLVLTILWDLKKVQTLSDIIHDDHASLWVDLNRSRLSEWYTPLDICILQLNNSSLTTEDYIHQNCSSFYIDDNNIYDNINTQDAVNAINLQRICHVGVSIGRTCDGPFSSRTYFTKRLHDDHLGDPHSGTLRRALNRIAKHNRSILFIGDGVSRQNQWAMICEMSRTNNITVEGDIYGPFIRIHWMKSNLHLDIHFIYIKTLKTFTSDSHHNNNHKSNSSSIPQLRERVTRLFQNYSGIVFITNVGAWYNSRDKFRTDIALFLNWLSGFGRKNLIFFRETAAQHWNHSNNGYFAKDGSASDGDCVALADSTPVLDWRNHDVKMFIENNRLERLLHLIPFRDITAPLHDMHPTGADGKDCTHFCYFPQLWQPVWNELDVHSFNSSKLRQL